MSPSTPPFHDLEFPNDVPLWPSNDTATRRVFLMPAPDPSLFVAFGVLGASAEVSFVARGSLLENLGFFIERMLRESARVGLYALPPVPRELIEKYGAPPPFEGHEFEAPPKPPVAGLASDRVQAYPARGSAPLWAQGGSAARRAILVPVRDPSGFLVLGLHGSPPTVLFALKGSVTEDLPRLLARLRREDCHVELFAVPPLPESVVGEYLFLPPAP
ncbi:hypothetical protein CYFUS_000651 [Cystobacter fuscus]|uniref:Uncharacterized protein n=1 Tax=Cystobacter fuscus TaxID=43 RepID=A0A250IU20_9BACT|nr:hypothetical protein [Cystobacter fuscus]ATB35239.1 hypothetical protein CYFUS_000651 [Cystobacter fuscus]